MGQATSRLLEVDELPPAPAARAGGALLIDLGASLSGPQGHYLRGLGLAYAGTLTEPRFDEAVESFMQAADECPDAELRGLIGHHWDNDPPRGGVIHARCQITLARYQEEHGRADDAQKRRDKARRALASAVYYGADAAALQQDPLLSSLFPLGER